MSPTKKVRRASASLRKDVLSLCVLVVVAVMAPAWVPAVFVAVSEVVSEVFVPLLTAGFRG